MQTLSSPLAALLAATLISGAGAATAGDIRTATIKSHPSQGEVAVVSDATARLHTDAGGVFVNMETSALSPGNVHTLWFVAINNPSACEGTPCTAKDALKRTESVQADVGYAGGMIVGEDGKGRFTYYQTTGALNGAWFEAGLQDTGDVEIHLVINDHGPAIEGRIEDMLTTYRGGCTDASIPKPMPGTARAQGIPGPNQCRLVQFSIFETKGAS